MSKKKNTEAIIQIIILLGIAILLIYSMLSGEISYYVHPRYYIGIWISILTLILFAISLISKINKARHNVNIRHYAIFVLPLAAALLFSPTGVSNKSMAIIAEGNNATLPAEQKAENLDLDIEKDVDVNTDSYADEYDNYEYDSTQYYQETDSYSNISQENKDEIGVEEPDISIGILDKYNKYKVDGILVISDDVFADWFYDVYDNLDKFIGERCQYLAQVYSMDDFEENQFIAGRYFMVCCAADLVGYGIVCESDIRSSLKDEEWITVTGTISKYKYNGFDVPMLTNVNITKAEAPEIEYIYFNNY